MIVNQRQIYSAYWRWPWHHFNWFHVLMGVFVSWLTVQKHPPDSPYRHLLAIFIVLHGKGKVYKIPCKYYKKSNILHTTLSKNNIFHSHVATLKSQTNPFLMACKYMYRKRFLWLSHSRIFFINTKIYKQFPRIMAICEIEGIKIKWGCFLFIWNTVEFVKTNTEDAVFFVPHFIDFRVYGQCYWFFNLLSSYLSDFKAVQNLKYTIK